MKSIVKIMLVFIISLLYINGCSSKKNSKDEGRYITICSYGGAFQEAQRKAYFEPFTKATGIEIREETYGGEFARIEMMVNSGKVDWDLVDVETDMLYRGIEKNLFEDIDYKNINKDDLLQEGINNKGVATDFFSTALAYSKKAFPTEKQPKTWKDFWDLKKYPGSRSLRRDPRSTLEIALLADGVEPKNLYPLDIDRAFASLEKIRPAVKVWWSSGHQPAELLSSGEISMASSFSARIWVAAKKEGKELGFTWEQALIDPEWWVVPKGSTKKELAMKFIEFASKAENQKNFPQYIGLGPVNKKALELIDPTLAKELNTYPENYKKQILIKADWWAKNYDVVLNKWIAWLSKNKVK